MPRKKAEQIEESNPEDMTGKMPSDKETPLELEPSVEGDDSLSALDTPPEAEKSSDLAYLDREMALEEDLGKFLPETDDLGRNERLAQEELPPAALDKTKFIDPPDLPEQEEDPEGMPPSEEKIEAIRRLKTSLAQPVGEERILTIELHDEIMSERERERSVWHEFRNSYYTKRILTGTLDSLETSPNGYLMAVVMYKGFRVVIPLREMLIAPRVWPEYMAKLKPAERLELYVNERMGADIDFIVMGSIGQAVAGSRREAMLRKRQRFYMMDRSDTDQPLIYPGRVVQARVVHVASKKLTVEAFGVECRIGASGLSWEWIGDARERYAVGDRVVIRVLTIDRQSVDKIEITADIRSICKNTSLDALQRCKPQDKYVGRVTDNHGGVVFIRLNNGANAIAHTCRDFRRPGRNDVVSFVVTKLDEKKSAAIGIITRIIRQNL